MTNIPPQEQRRRLVQAYNTLRRSICWALQSARCEWIHDNCRYPFRNYHKHGMRENIKAAWFLRDLIRVSINHTSHDL